MDWYNKMKKEGGKRMPKYFIYLLEFAHGKSQALSWAISGEHNKGIIENVPFTYVLIQGEGRTMLIDTGFDDNPSTHDFLEGFGCIDWQPPEHILRKVGVHPKDIDMIFLTHAHYDHMGNMRAFPNAKFYIQKREIMEWLVWFSLPKRFQWFSFPVDRNDIMLATKMIIDKRMILLDGEVSDIAPGITLIPAYDTHTFGLQMVSIRANTDSGEHTWVCVSDNAHEYTNIEGINKDGIYRPIGFATGGSASIILSLEKAMKLADDVNHLIIPHAQESFKRYPSRIYDDGLRVAELATPPGEKSRIA